MNTGSAPPNVPLGELRDLIAPGAPLPFSVLDSLGRLLLASGKLVVDDDQVHALVERGGCVDPAEAQAARAARGGGGAGAANSAGAESSGGAATRVPTWFDRVEKQVWVLDELQRGMARGTTKAAQIEAFGDAFITLIERHFDAALFLCLRQQDRRFALYALTHAMHTATVSLLTARQLGWAVPAQRQVVLAALTMNASIVELQARMAEQDAPPSKKQLEQIHGHPLQSAQLLRACGVDDAEWLRAVEEHHEKPGGGGYPKSTAEVCKQAHVLRAADIFTAKVSPRAGRVPLVPQLAARQLFEEEKGGPVAAGLIKAVGIYPPGDFVWLKSGEAGIVVHRAAPGRAPVVVALLGANGKPVAGAPRRDTGQAAYAITGVLAERTNLPRVLPEQVYGLLNADAPPA